MLSLPTSKNISLRIPPNYSTWETIEYTHQVCRLAVEQGIEGDMVECGVAAGNNFGVMLLHGRKGWGFDSFEGIPWAGPNDDEQPGFRAKPRYMEGETSGISAHTMENVIADLKKWDCGTNYELVKGWFKDSISVNAYRIDKIAVLRLDGDLYESTMTPLVHLWPKVPVGGYLIVDDWALLGCKRACNDFFGDYSTVETILDGSPKYFRRIK